MVLGNYELTFFGPRHAAPSSRYGIGEGANAVLGRGDLYGETPAPPEEYRDALKTRGEKSRPDRRLDVREGLARGAPCSLGDIHPRLVTFTRAAFGYRAGRTLPERAGRCACQGLDPLAFGTFSAVVYFLIVITQVIVSPIPAGPVTFAGAVIFGVPQGLALSMAGSVVGSALVFAAARRWCQPLVMRLVGEETFYKYAGRLDREGWWLLAILLVPFMPDDAACALAGLSAISFRRFLVFVVVGRLPGATLTALLASDLLTRSVAGWIVVGMVLVALLVLGFVYRKPLESWILRRADEGQNPSGSYGESKGESSR